MQVRNTRDYPVGLEATEFDFYADVEAGDVIEVPDALGERLLEQKDNWKAVKQVNKHTSPAWPGKES